jgi:pyridinium-3,5-biscarboxylic acid mononucleotide synthase
LDSPGLRKLLDGVRSGKIPVSAAEEQLKDLPFADLGFATVDLHRELRRGFPETVYGEGKSAAQIVTIVRRLRQAKQTALVTRVSKEVAAAVRRAVPQAKYHPSARALVVGARRPVPERSGVLVVTAGTTDAAVAEEAALTAELMGEKVARMTDVGVAGLHRLLSRRKSLSEANVIVVVAGMEGALPSVVAGLVACPVIAVPTSVGYGTGAGGFAALLAMLNSCAAGVAVVNIDNGHGAGCLASLINRGCHSATRTSLRRR